MAVLARVINDTAEPRGPDLAHAIEVPLEWLVEGATLAVGLPRLLMCARCDGGGCDVCSRRGAFDQPASGAPSEVTVLLPATPSPSGAIRLRLPASGARAAHDDTLPAGHLLLTITPRPVLDGWLPPASVRRLTPRATAASSRRSRARIWAVALATITMLAWWLLTRR